jgi:hypothetical protein
MGEAQRELSRGESFEGYKIRQPIGEGQVGRVYTAIHPTTGAKVAIRLVHPHLLPQQGPEALVAALQPACGLRHPNLVPLLACGLTPEGTIYTITEFATGRPLTELLDRSARLTCEETTVLLEALAAGLAAAHERGVIHGTLSPGCVWLTPREDGSWPPRLQTMDLGLDPLLRLPAEGGADLRLPYYLAPEQCRGEPASVATDIYAVGVVAYQMLTGRLPFSSAVPAEVLRMHLNDDPPPPGRYVELAAEAEAFVLRALHKQPSGRFGSMNELRQATEKLALAGAAAPVTEPPATDAETEAQPPPEPPEAEPPPAEPALVPVTTGVLPRSRGGGGRLFISALLALLAALVVGAVLYRSVVGEWPLGRTPAASDQGRLVVVTDPPGATVYLDTVRQHGRTPLTLPSLRQGQAYDLYLHLPGHRPWRQRIALGIGEEERALHVSLPRRSVRFGTLKLSSNVKADFFLDGRKVGTQTREVTLVDVQAEIDHQLRVVAPQREPADQVVRVEPGVIRVLQFDLPALR